MSLAKPKVVPRIDQFSCLKWAQEGNLPHAHGHGADVAADTRRVRADTMLPPAGRSPAFSFNDIILGYLIAILSDARLMSATESSYADGNDIHGGCSGTRIFSGGRAGCGGTDLWASVQALFLA